MWRTRNWRSPSWTRIGDGWRPAGLPGQAGFARSEGEHPADQCLPGDGADDAVDGDQRDVQVHGLLEAADGGVRFGPEDPVDLQALARVAGQVAELELLLEPAHSVTLAALLDRDDQRRPGGGADDAVDGQALLLLEGADGCVGTGPENAVHGDVTAAGPEQVLQGLDGMFLVTLADKRKWADRGGSHRFLLARRGQRTLTLTEEPRKSGDTPGRLHAGSRCSRRWARVPASGAAAFTAPVIVDRCGRDRGRNDPRSRDHEQRRP